MGLLFRGVVWFGLYVLLAVLPLALAVLVDPFPASRGMLVETGVGAGLVAFSLMAMQFALVTRLKAASLPFGTDALMQFHAQLGIVAVALVVLHPLLLLPVGPGPEAWQPFTGNAGTRSGALALWAALLILLTSLFRRRLRLSYGAWNAAHLLGALVVVGAMTWHVLAVSGYAGTPVMGILLSGYTALALLLMLRYRVARPLLLRGRPWVVVENRDEGADTRTLRLRPSGHGGLAFQPGQFAWLITGSNPLWGAQHPVTISSSAEIPASGDLEFSIKALGDWSGRVVPGLSEGDRVWVDGPYGVFTPDREPGQGFVMIAGGIGISPMRSMLLTMRDRGDRRPVTLLYAARDPGRAMFLDELAALSRDMELEVVHVWEEPEADWKGERGFIDEAMLRRHLPARFRHYQFFVCGPDAMTGAMERALSAVGVPAERIHSERFNFV